MPHSRHTTSEVFRLPHITWELCLWRFCVQIRFPKHCKLYNMSTCFNEQLVEVSWSFIIQTSFILPTHETQSFSNSSVCRSPRRWSAAGRALSLHLSHFLSSVPVHGIPNILPWSNVTTETYLYYTRNVYKHIYAHRHVHIYVHPRT